MIHRSKKDAKMASDGSGLLEFLLDHAEASGVTLRVYGIYHPLEKHDAA
jgi:hypothetical protein